MTEEGPNLAEALSHFPLDFAWLAVLGLASGLYVRAFRRVPRGAAQPGHPTWKLLAFHGGLFTVALAVSSPIEYYGNALLWMNFLGFLILTMVAAPLILLGSPLTLAFRVAGPAGRSRLRRLYRGRLLTVATFPVVSWLAFAVVTYAWQFTSLTDEALVGDHDPCVMPLATDELPMQPDEIALVRRHEDTPVTRRKLELLLVSGPLHLCSDRSKAVEAASAERLEQLPVS